MKFNIIYTVQPGHPRVIEKAEFPTRARADNHARRNMEKETFVVNGRTFKGADVKKFSIQYIGG